MPRTIPTIDELVKKPFMKQDDSYQPTALESPSATIPQPPVVPQETAISVLPKPETPIEMANAPAPGLSFEEGDPFAYTNSREVASEPQPQEKGRDLVAEEYDRQLLQLNELKRLKGEEIQLSVEKAMPQQKQVKPIPVWQNIMMLSIDAYTGKPQWLHHLTMERPQMEAKVAQENQVAMEQYQRQLPLLKNKQAQDTIGLEMAYKKGKDALDLWKAKQSGTAERIKSIKTRITTIEGYARGLDRSVRRETETKRNELYQKFLGGTATPEEMKEYISLSEKISPEASPYWEASQALRGELLGNTDPKDLSPEAQKILKKLSPDMVEDIGASAETAQLTPEQLSQYMLDTWGIEMGEE